jgi:ABC-2 type transport system ATP-binding protein
VGDDALPEPRADADGGPEPAISVADLHEVYRIYADRPPGIKERLAQFRRTHYRTLHALDGVSLDIQHGESVGLIGHNGSGKTTLLKCMARILAGDRGTVGLNGRVATLLELGAGFQPDLSGRENIYLNGSILGLSRKEIDDKLDSIVEFAGVADFIETPVRNYSSGMYVRLGFAVAVHVDPDILLIDEVLSVGDATFQEKSFDQMRAFHERGKTVVLVSHSLDAIQSLCDRGVVMHHGRVDFDGPIEQAIAHYERLTAAGREGPAVPEHADAPTGGDGRAAITGLSFEAPGFDPAESIPTGSRALLECEVTAVDDLVDQGGLTLGMAVRRPDLPSAVYETRTAWRVTYVAPPPEGESFRVVFEFELNMLTGTYVIDLVVGNAETDVVHELRQDAVKFVVASPTSEFGIAALDARIAIDNPEGVWPTHALPPPRDQGGPRYSRWRDEGVAPPGWRHGADGWEYVGEGADAHEPGDEQEPGPGQSGADQRGAG